MARSRGQHRGALVGGQLHGPGQEISVQMRVGGERYPQAPPGGGLAQGPQVTRGVDGQRPPIAQVSQVGGVPQALIDQRDQMVTGIAHQALQQQRVNRAKPYNILNYIGRVRSAHSITHGPATYRSRRLALGCYNIPKGIGAMMLADERARKTALYEQFARVGKALANPARLELLDLLAQGERSVEELAEVAGMKVSNTSAQLRALASAGLVASRRDGVRIYYRLADDDVCAFVGQLQA